MRAGHSGAVSADVPGHIVQAIFGFCDIRNFTDCTEVATDGITVFLPRTEPPCASLRPYLPPPLSS